MYLVYQVREFLNTEIVVIQILSFQFQTYEYIAILYCITKKFLLMASRSKYHKSQSSTATAEYFIFLSLNKSNSPIQSPGFKDIISVSSFFKGLLFLFVKNFKTVDS